MYGRKIKYYRNPFTIRMRNFYLICFLLGIFQVCFAQNSPDHIYQVDQSDFSSFVDEIRETEIIYFSPDDLTKKQPKSILKSKVWKIIYANGETEIFSAPAVLVLDKIHLTSGKILEARISELTLESVSYKMPIDNIALKIARAEVYKIVYANGYEEILNDQKIAESVNEIPKVPEKTRVGKEEEAEKVVAINSDPKGKSKRNVEKQEEKENENVPGSRPNEIIIKIQNDFDPKNNAEKQEVRTYKNYVGFRFGGSATGFYESKIAKPKRPSYNWEVGLGISLVNSKHYNARLEFVYANKGAIEKFEDKNLTITSRNKFTYFQGNLLPLILKTGARKLNPVFGAGGYYAYKFKNSSEYSEDGKNFEDDEDAAELFDNKFDYGLCAMLGFYSGHKPLLEFRYEYGLGEVIKAVKIKNHGLSVSLFLAF